MWSGCEDYEANICNIHGGDADVYIYIYTQLEIMDVAKVWVIGMCTSFWITESNKTIYIVINCINRFYLLEYICKHISTLYMLSIHYC